MRRKKIQRDGPSVYSIVLRRAELAEAQLTCESHEGYRLVWCNECCRIDREAWEVRLAQTSQDILAVQADNLRLQEALGGIAKKLEQADQDSLTMQVKNMWFKEALGSIASNTCCDRCQEAALVARAALSRTAEAG